jgi:hypothetical protein
MFFVLKLPVYKYTLTPPPHLFAVPPETKGCGGSPTEATPGREKSGSGIDEREAESGGLGPDAEVSVIIAGEQGDPQPRPKPATRATPVEPLRDLPVRSSSAPHRLARSFALRSTRTGSVSTRRPVVGDVSTPESNTFVPSLHLVRLYQLDVVGLGSDCERVFPT